jgi:transposase
MPRRVLRVEAREFAGSHKHINGIEPFWSYVKRRMRKHNGTPRRKFPLYLKEAEFRFNHRDEKMFPIFENLILKQA